MSPTPAKPTFRFRTIFISDVHLGFRGCSAAYLLDFLRSVETETLYLVGDIIDVWSLRRSFFWPQQKNIEAFLDLDLPGTKLVIGDGPERRTLQAEFPTARFVGYKFGAELAAYLAATDVFVFPSRTDTFGLVLLEALACGVPVAAYPVIGPIDVIENGTTGVLDEDQFVANLAPRGETFCSRDKAESITPDAAL